MVVVLQEAMWVVVAKVVLRFGWVGGTRNVVGNYANLNILVGGGDVARAHTY